VPGLDTNVLVRWLVADDEAQTHRTGMLFEATRARQGVLFIPSTVALELEWVLRSRYRFSKADVLATYAVLLETQELEFESETALERALHLYRQSTADFADCLHAGLCAAADQSPLLTFDRKAAGHPEVQLLET
jgi:predicted nucleic-acid-binding protein